MDEIIINWMTIGSVVIIIELYIIYNPFWWVFLTVVWNIFTYSTFIIGQAFQVFWTNIPALRKCTTPIDNNTTTIKYKQEDTTTTTSHNDDHDTHLVVPQPSFGEK
eukprot:431082_1